jgi:hypothetical protein
MSAWGGRRVTEARKRIAQLLPMPCAACGLPVTAATPWDIGHTIGRDIAPDLMWDTSLWRVEHSRCNRAAGARYRNAKHNRRVMRTTSRDW